MISPHHCKCGCGDNVSAPGVYVPGHEKPSVANEHKKNKARILEKIRKDKAARRDLPPHFGRPCVQITDQRKTPVKAPFFGRGN